MLKELYVGLKTKPFVMLLARGHIQMTAVPREFAKAYGATAENGRYLEIRVPMDWMDSSDLFGVLDLEGRFRPGGLIDFLKKAQLDPEKPYFLCLDGILLSRAEYYLREVLASVRNKTPLVPTIYYGRDQQALEKYGEIPALSNLYIIGTTNLDMASLPLNQKLLDQVYTIYMKRPLEETLPEAKDLTPVYENLGDCLEQAQAYFPLFEQLNSGLMKANAYVGFAMRNDGILWLLNNDVLEEAEAVDYVICHKVLTRVQGSPKTILPALEQLEDFCRGKYPKAAAAIAEMKENCKATGFASYWD